MSHQHVQIQRRPQRDVPLILESHTAAREEVQQQAYRPVFAGPYHAFRGFCGQGRVGGNGLDSSVAVEGQR